MECVGAGICSGEPRWMERKKGNQARSEKSLIPWNPRCWGGGGGIMSKRMPKTRPGSIARHHRSGGKGSGEGKGFSLSERSRVCQGLRSLSIRRISIRAAGERILSLRARKQKKERSHKLKVAPSGSSLHQEATPRQAW